MVFAKESGRQGKAGQCQRADHERPVGDRQFILEAAHAAHVLFVMQGDDDGSASEKEEGFEGAVGQEMVHAGGIGAETAGHDHVAELADCRIGHDTLDVGLGQGDGRPNTIVTPPVIATTVMAVGDRLYSGANRATMNTPAVTIVAA